MRCRLRRSRSADSAADNRRATDPEAARAAAVTLLARRDFASTELRAKLLSQGYDEAAVAAAIEALIESRALDDARYAENYVVYHARRGQGPLRIAAQLKAMDLPPEIIESALASGPDWKTLAREARIRKFGPQEPPNWAEKARQARFLQYRGFSSDHIRSALGPDFDPDE